MLVGCLDGVRPTHRRLPTFPCIINSTSCHDRPLDPLDHVEGRHVHHSAAAPPTPSRPSSGSAQLMQEAIPPPTSTAASRREPTCAPPGPVTKISDRVTSASIDQQPHLTILPEHATALLLMLIHLCCSATTTVSPEDMWPTREWMMSRYRRKALIRGPAALEAGAVGQLTGRDRR